MGRWLIETEQRTTLRFGGLPDAPPGFAWPLCAECRGPMQFLAQLPLRDLDLGEMSALNEYLLIFQCQNQPGLCEEWSATSGGNAAVLVPGGGAAMHPPPFTSAMRERGLSGVTLLTGVSYGRAVPDDETPDDLVLGAAGGEPDWIRPADVPSCPGCRRPMTFAVQFEAHTAGLGMNFGDSGVAYAFVCGVCRAKAGLLVQSL